MLRTTKNMKDKYEKIQNCLFELIPERWEEIYLYASIVDREGNIQTGEMYFYYLPKGVLKRKPVNVYEVPKKFNINENEYLKLVDSLYNVIKDLRLDFVNTEQKLWTNLTISIAHCRFKVEYFYNQISQEEYASYVRHVIWRYKYLKLGGEIKEERKILEKYFDNSQKNLIKEEYQTGMYLKNANNVVGFDKEIEAKQLKQLESKQKAEEQELKKSKKIRKKAMLQEEKRRKEAEKNKNQILNL
jgi:hypothetical protein